MVVRSGTKQIGTNRRTHRHLADEVIISITRSSNHGPGPFCLLHWFSLSSRLCGITWSIVWILDAFRGIERATKGTSDSVRNNSMLWTLTDRDLLRVHDLLETYSPPRLAYATILKLIPGWLNYQPALSHQICCAILALLFCVRNSPWNLGFCACQEMCKRFRLGFKRVFHSKRTYFAGSGHQNRLLTSRPPIPTLNTPSQATDFSLADLFRELYLARSN